MRLHDRRERARSDLAIVPDAAVPGRRVGALGEVGRAGTAIGTIADVRTAFERTLLDEVFT